MAQAKTYENIDSFSFSPEKPLFAYSTSTKDGVDNQLEVLNLDNKQSRVVIDQDALGFNHLTWGSKRSTTRIFTR